MSINWQQKRTVVESVETGEHYVIVGGYMLAEDYVRDGGRVETEIGETLHVGVMTNVELQQQYA